MSEIPCRACGVATDRDVRWFETPASVTNGVVRHASKFQRGTCEACESLRLREPGDAVRACLRLLGRPEGDDGIFAAVLLDAELDATEAFFPGGRPNSSPWRHVSNDFRRNLKRAYVQVLVRKVERDTPPVPVPPPMERPHHADRCLICGAAEDVTWHGYVTLSTRGGGSITGCLCGSNCAPVYAHIGSFGTQFEGNAYLATLGEPVDLGLDRIPGLRPWYGLSDVEKEAATGRFSWVTPARESIAPIEDQGVTVEGLAATVAQLQNELAMLRGAQG